MVETVLAPLDPGLLPAGVRARFIQDVNGLRMHMLEAGHEGPGRPLILLVHGFPEIAYSWRKIMPALAAAGYHVVAPDLRGYGRTLSEPVAYGDDLAPYRLHNHLLDVMSLMSALGRTQVAALVGHDYGAWVCSYAALARPDLFGMVTLMSAPFIGPPTLESLARGIVAPEDDPIHAALAALPRPREHYHRYYATPAAAADMERSPRGLGAFLRAYFHQKSADWPGNHPGTLAGWTAEALAGLPTYYVMDRGRTMPETVAPEMPADGGVGCGWLTDEELSVYVAEYTRSGFQGPLHGYRCRMDGSTTRDFARFAGRRLETPLLFISGASDWGPYQVPGALERMHDPACVHLLGCHFIEGAGHWIQQERPQAVIDLLLEALGRA